MSQSEHYAIIKHVSTDFDTTIQAVTEALKSQGFGILSTIDVSGTLKKRLNADHPRTTILGACNPQFAHQVLTATADISTLLPCNVVVREGENGIEVAAFNPMVMVDVVDDASVAEVAPQVSERIRNALEALT
ncbi:MAG: DUF302 domain-containing protein [Magnetococcales bacterium]|nr:DUF302 domain-containing protein [Magnetococcales bacterium]